MSNPIRLGVLGIGRIGKMHIKNILTMSEYEILCGVDPFLTPELEKLGAECPELVIGKISVEDPENIQLAASLGVNAIPALFFYRNGKLEKQLAGYMTKDQLKAQLGL